MSAVNTSPAALLALAEGLTLFWTARPAIAALRAVAAEKEASQWRPIETAPKDGTAVLLRDKDGAVFSAHWEARFIGEHDDGGDCWATTATQWLTRAEGRVDYFDSELNGWMPLPT